MNKVNNYQEISKLIFANLKKDVITNTFLAKKEFENEILNGNLYYSLINNGVLIIRDRKDYIIINYYLNDVNNKENIVTLKNEIQNIYKYSEVEDKKIVIEVVGKEECNEKYLQQVNLFMQIGLHVAIKRVRLSKKLDINSLSVDNVEILEPNIKFCEEDDIQEILEILRENFDKYYGCIPDIEFLRNEIKNKNFFKYTTTDKIIGILQIKNSSKSSEIRHLAVKKEHRNKGVAKKLIEKYDKEIKTNNKTVWTGVENKVAQGIYEKNGYLKDGYVSTVFMQ